MVNLVLIFAFVCLLLAYGVGRFAAWLYLKKKFSILAAGFFAALLVFAVYVLAVMPPYLGTFMIALPFAIGFGEGNAAYLIALFCQGLITWIFSLLFFWGICWLKKYDEEYERKHKND